MKYRLKVYSVEEATRKIERFCAYQERCHKEVTQKLRDMGMIPIAADNIIVHLIEHDFLNEERFATSFVRGKFNQKKWGKIRLTRELKMRNISNILIKNALKQISDLDYKNVFHKLAERKNDSILEDNKQKKRKKLANYLLYRGWESDMVYDKIRELIP